MDRRWARNLVILHKFGASSWRITRASGGVMGWWSGGSGPTSWGEVRWIDISTPPKWPSRLLKSHELPARFIGMTQPGWGGCLSPMSASWHQGTWSDVRVMRSTSPHRWSKYVGSTPHPGYQYENDGLGRVWTKHVLNPYDDNCILVRGGRSSKYDTLNPARFSTKIFRISLRCLRIFPVWETLRLCWDP